MAEIAFGDRLRTPTKGEAYEPHRAFSLRSCAVFLQSGKSNVSLPLAGREPPGKGRSASLSGERLGGFADEGRFDRREK